MKALRRVDHKNASRLVEGAARKGNLQPTRSLSCLSYFDPRNSNETSRPAHRVFSTRTAPYGVEQQPTTTYGVEDGYQEDKSTPLLDYETAKAMIKVLDEPDFNRVGAFSPSTWKAMHHLVKSWVQFQTGESVDASFALLERLVLEQELLMQNRNSIAAEGADLGSLEEAEERREMQQLSRDFLDTDLLNMVIKNWRFVWKGNTGRQRENVLSPRALLPLLEEYIDRSPSLHPSNKTYNMILDSLTRRFSGQVAEKLASEIYYRMAKQPLLGKEEQKFELSPTPTLDGSLRCINDISPNNYTYSTLINVFSQARNPKAAEEVLCRFSAEFLEGKVEEQPNVYCFSACINAWAKSQLPQAPEKAQSVMDLMGCLDLQPPMQNVEPNVVAYNALLDCWAKSGREDAGEKAEALLRKMEDMPNIQPDSISYNTVIRAHEQSDGNITKAKETLKRMYNESHSRDGKFVPKPTRDSYMLLIRAMSRQAGDDPKAAYKAERTLLQMIQMGHQPCVAAYNAVLLCWAHSEAPESAECAERLFEIMRYPPPELRIRPVQPNTLTYNSVITALANAKQAPKAEKYFWQMYQEHSQGNRTAKPQLRSFNTVLAAWKSFPGIPDSERLKQILRLFQKIPKRGGVAIKPDVVSCNTLLQALAEMGTEQNRTRAMMVLQELEKDYNNSKDEALRPDKLTYTFAMRANALLGDLNGTRNVFNRMLEDYQNGNEKARPDIVTMNNLLSAIARGARGRNRGAGELAEKVFQQVYELNASGIMNELPSKKSYDIKINCWANSGSIHAGVEADRIIQEMTDKASNGFPDLEPNMISYTTAMNAHARSGNYIGAEGYFQRMLEEYSNGNKKMKPSLRTINTVLSACAKANTPEAAEKAEAYLREMLLFRGFSQLDLEPDAITFTTVISAWANSGDPRAGERALSLFNEIDMLSRKAGSTMRLDSGFYRAVIRACAVSCDTTTAESLLEKINDKEIKGVRADRVMYSALLEAYANSGSKDAAEKADLVLKRMNEEYASTGNEHMQPRADCYMRVMECWGNSDDHKKAIERSEALLLQMEKLGKAHPKIKPTAVAYNIVINTVARAGDTEKTKALMKRMYANTSEIDRASMEAIAV